MRYNTLFRSLPISFITSMLGIVLVSCTKTIDLSKLVNSNQPIYLSQIRNDSSIDQSLIIFHDSILPNSDRWNKLIAWGEQNHTGWKTDIASRNCGTFLRQNELTMCIGSKSDFVMIQYNENHKGKQLVKNIEKGSLNFLFVNDPKD